MSTLTRNQQWLIGGILLLLMLLTRSHFVNHIQDASWAVFFLVGFYVRSYLGFPLFWLSAFSIDLTVIKTTGADNFCFTQAYLFLIPAYASLWVAGRWLANHYAQNWRTGIYFAAAAVIGVTTSFTISNAGFYQFSGHFSEMGIMEYVQNIREYLPQYLQTTLLYLGIAGMIHLAVTRTSELANETPHA